MRSSRRFLEGLVIAVAAGGLAGCGGPKGYVRPGFLDHPPARVAVLPFAITYPYDLAAGQPLPPSHTIGRDVFRKTFYYALTPYGYDDVKLAEVDDKLAAAWGPIEQGAWQQASPQALGERLGADALIYGDISRLMHFATPLYTETSLDASLRMVDAASGEVLWRTRVKAAERGGALMKKSQVVDFLKDQARSFNPSVKFLRVSDSAVRQALKDLPNPPMRVDAEVATERAAEGAPRLAVLPLEARPAWRKAAIALRGYLAANLQESPFEIVEINRIDAALVGYGWHEGEPLPSALPLPELADAVGADALLRGLVTTWGRTYWVVESSVSAGLALELMDADSGEVIWADRHRNSRQAGVLKGPTGYKALATAPIMGLKRSHLERVANHLTRAMVERLTRSPAVQTYLSDRP